MRPSFPKSLPTAFLALIFGLLLSCAAASGSADELPEAQRLMRQGQLPQALEKVDAYLAGKPKEAQGRFLKGLILTEMGRSNEAIAVFNGLTEDYPELPEPYNNLAVLYAQQKQYEKARTALEMAIRTHPGYAVAYDNLGDIYAKLASQAYEKALQLEASNKTTKAKLALTRELIGSAANTASRQGTALRPATEPARPALAPAPAGAPQIDPPPAAASGDEAAVTRTLQGWASAWSRKDAKAYLAYYAADFRRPAGMSRKDWENERLQRASKPGRIQIELEDIRIAFADDKAIVKFRQHYSSRSRKSSTAKTIVFVKSRGRWLIQQERID